MVKEPLPPDGSNIDSPWTGGVKKTTVLLAGGSQMAASVRGVDALQDELERAKERLKYVDENIKRLTGRDPTEPRPGGGVRGRRLSAGGPAGEARGRGRLFAQARRAIADPDGPSPPKRRPSRGAFSRLGPRVMASSVRGPRRTIDSGDEEELPYKPTIQSSVIAAKKEPKSRTEIITAQNRDEKGKARNRRMFGLLMGTLQRFKDESATNEVVTKQRKAIEEKLEMKAKQEKEELKMERRNLFQERRQKQAKLRTLEQKLELARIHEEWERQTRALASSIRTKASPPVYWRPRRHNAASEKCLKETVKLLEGIIAERKQKLEEEIEALTQTVEEEKENEEEDEEQEEEKMETEDGETGDRDRDDEGGKEGIDEVKHGEAMDTSEPLSEAEKHTGGLGEGVTEQTDKQGLATANLDQQFTEDMSSPIRQTDSGREKIGEDTDRRHVEETGDKKSRRDSKSRRGSSRDEDPSKIGDHRRESRRSGEGHRRDSRGSKERESKGSRHRRDSGDFKERDSRGSREEGTRGSKDSRDKDSRTSREGESRGSRERDSQAGRDRDKEEKRKRSRTLSERSEEERSEQVQRRRVVMGPEDAEDGDRGGSWPKGDSVED